MNELQYLIDHFNLTIAIETAKDFASLTWLLLAAFAGGLCLLGLALWVITLPFRTVITFLLDRRINRKTQKELKALEPERSKS